MYSIETSVENTIIIKKSKFICKLYKICNEKETDTILKNIKKEYKDSTHICYCYIVNNIIRNSDDGEPSGTAGIPIYNVLSKNNLNMVLCIVIRYFGGIKLGAGGLIRAYSNSVIETLKLTNIIELMDGYNVEISFKYDNIKSIDTVLKDVNNLNKRFDDIIIYNFNISINDYNIIYNKLKNICIDINIKEKILVQN